MLGVGSFAGGDGSAGSTRRAASIGLTTKMYAMPSPTTPRARSTASMPSTSGHLDLFAGRAVAGDWAVSASGSVGNGAEPGTGPVPVSRMVGDCGEMTCVPLDESDAAGADGGSGAEVVGAGGGI